MKKRIKVGSRDSILAVCQAKIVMEAIKKFDPGAELELVTIKTTGDLILDKSLYDIGGKGLFIKEFELALAKGAVDIAVHSYKDMPCEETDGLPVVALSEREAPFDALVLPSGISELDRTKPIGTSSLRRAAQLAKIFCGCTTDTVRGNIQTRLSKLDEGRYSALILAQAALNRLSLQHRISRVFDAEEMIPACSQGIIAVQGRRGENHTYFGGFNSNESQTVSKAERTFLKTLGGGCSSPVAVYGRLYGNEINITGMYVDADGNIKTGKIDGDADRAEALGEALANRLKGAVG